MERYSLQVKSFSHLNNLLMNKKYCITNKMFYIWKESYFNYFIVNVYFFSSRNRLVPIFITITAAPLLL